MGAPSSAMFSDIFLQYVEFNFVIDIIIDDKTLGYLRYVDDVLIVCDH